jgi:hypothetical protein
VRLNEKMMPDVTIMVPDLGKQISKINVKEKRYCIFIVTDTYVIHVYVLHIDTAFL